jgi:hypothetical protein
VQQLDAMCRGIEQALQADHERARSANESQVRAQALAKRFVLTHRTVSVGGATLQDIFSDKCLRATPPCTSRELDCGVDCAVYFFLGCAAYPEGAVAFLVPSHVLGHMPASYSPFDSGSLSRFARPRDSLQPWGEPDKRSFLALHLGDGADAVAFSAEYVAAHFKDATDYVCRPQQSEPDFPTYHDLVSTSGDRRAWSIEVRLHASLDLDADHIQAIVIGQPDLLADIPDDLVQKLVVVEDEGSITTRIHQLIVQEASS